MQVELDTLEKQQLADENKMFADEIARLRECTELSSTLQSTVFSNPCARFMYVKLVCVTSCHFYALEEPLLRSQLSLSLSRSLSLSLCISFALQNLDEIGSAFSMFFKL